MQGKNKRYTIAAISVNAAALAVCIFLCTRVRTGNAAKLDFGESISYKGVPVMNLVGKGFDPRKLLAPGAEAICATVREKIELFGSADKA